MAQPYIMAPLPPSSSAIGTPVRNPPYIAQSVHNISPRSSASASQPLFQAPAHKHAHHLHSIPPREKSTRTLIIDHMLWVHGRTRFAQARAELGMTDRTGGPSSPNYTHRRRPENYEEEEDEYSDGEDVIMLKARGDHPHPRNDDEEARARAQDLPLACNLRLRAEGLEKVVTSMLGQPPPIHPKHDEDMFTPPTSPKLSSSHSIHPHALPNGVRLRLALGTMINDLFARQAPPPPYRHQLHSSPSKTSTPTNSSLATPLSPATTVSTLPPALASLARISAISNKFFQTQSSLTDYNTPYPNQIQHKVAAMPSSRIRSLYMAGADPSTANSPPSLRCPRHLHTGCEICVEASSGGRPNGTHRVSAFGGDLGARPGQANGRRGRGMSGGSIVPGGGISGWQDGSGIGSGLLRPGVKGSVLRRRISEDDASDDGAASAGAGNAKLSSLIPRFIRLSALVAAELGREAREDDDESGSYRSTEAGDSGDGHVSRSEGGWGIGQSQHPPERGDFIPLPNPSAPSPATHGMPQQNRLYEYSLYPSREWYMLLAGLLTRAVLEGYLTAGWRGSQPVECLLTVGLGLVERTSSGESLEDNEFGEFDPDELPSLLDATKLLFPALRFPGPYRKGPAEEEFEMEMDERLRRFYDIPGSTPDLSTHMEDLAWKYPAEPVERAAVRFCEAIAKWRGKPELETYKKKPARQQYSNHNHHNGNGNGRGHDVVNIPMNPVNLLGRPSPTSPTVNGAGGRGRYRSGGPSIDAYFTQPMQETPTIPLPPHIWNGNGNGNKRARSPDDGRGSSKRLHG